MPRKSNAFLVGPFIGELSWEFYRFAPYIINLKKEHPTKKVIVFTRPSRFDLYGLYADVLVPLKLTNDKSNDQYCFKIKGFDAKKYGLISKVFTTKYKKEYKKIVHIYPDISGFSYKIKWQYSRNLMDYDFKPRAANSKYIKKYISDDLILYNFDNKIPPQCLRKYNIEFADIFFEDISATHKNPNLTPIGCLIELIRKCKFVVSPFDSYIAHLALLLKTPVIAPRKDISEDKIKLLNPLNTSVILYDKLEMGIDCYENNM